jgi:serpin B
MLKYDMRLRLLRLFLGFAGIARIRLPIFVAFGVLVLLSVGSAPPEARQETTPEQEAVAEGNSRFTLELFSRLKTTDENQILSPFSVYCALAMVYAGAGGNTEVQIAQSLHFQTNQSSFHSGMSAFLASFTNLSKNDVELNIGNGLWAQSGYQLKTEFTKLCRNDYRADLDFVDFQTGAETARQRINTWIDRTTRGKIKDLFAPGAIHTDTRLAIANAIYFNGKWASRFDKEKTHASEFWVSPEKTTQVPMMWQKSTFLFLADEDTQILELPYRGESISMLVLLPKDRDGLAKLEEQLNGENLVKWIKLLHPADVDLLLPKFKMSSRFSLNQPLAGMGMPDAFDAARADFTGMTAQRPLFINVVEHAAIVEVDEEGTVAAAGTGVSFGCSKMPVPATFHADHPFIFLILDRSTHTPLFMGKVANPGASKD